MKLFHWFLSFRDDEANVNLGGCMVAVSDNDPPSIEVAVEAAWSVGCNPGGEVLGFTAEGSDPDIAKAVEAMPEGVLLTREQVDDLWAPFGIVAGRPHKAGPSRHRP